MQSYQYKTLTTCPKCQHPMEQVAYANIEIDRCTHCYGLWFDAQEAEKLKKVQGSEIIDNGDPELGRQYNQTCSPHKLPCPRCSKKMNRLLDIDRFSIWYEKCPHCQGIWLDAGEFKKFKQNFTTPSLLERAKQAIPFIS